MLMSCLKSLEEHQDKYFSKKKFDHLKLPTTDKNVGSLLLVSANHLTHCKNTILIINITYHTLLKACGIPKTFL